MKAQWIVSITAAAALGLFAGALPARAAQQEASSSSAQNQQGQFSHKDFRFLSDAARGGMEEVQLGQVAEQKAGSPAVREFGQRMVSDHNKANEELRQIASQKGAALPTKMSMLENYRAEHLQKLSGADFDRAYVADMIKDHKKDARDFEAAVKNLTDPELRAWAQKTLAVVQQHLQAAQNLEASIKVEK